MYQELYGVISSKEAIKYMKDGGVVADCYDNYAIIIGDLYISQDFEIWHRIEFNEDFYKNKYVRMVDCENKRS